MKLFRTDKALIRHTLNERQDLKERIVTQLLVYEAGLALTIGNSKKGRLVLVYIAFSLSIDFEYG